MNYDPRIARADLLAAKYPFAAEILRFYRQVAALQRDLYGSIGKTAVRRTLSVSATSFRDYFDVRLLLPHFPAFLKLVERAAPAPLAGAARHFAGQDARALEEVLTTYLFAISFDSPPLDALAAFFPRAVLQPYAEFFAERTESPHLDTTPRVCPLCSARPLLGALRPEGDGAKRSLVCSFCSHEWDFRRIFCPACGEEREDKLPVYVSEQFPHIRVEVCDTCKSYIRTIDLTKDGHAVPIVDDLAAIPLGLWAAEHGYSRLHPNLLGT